MKGSGEASFKTHVGIFARAFRRACQRASRTQRLWRMRFQRSGMRQAGTYLWRKGAIVVVVIQTILAKVRDIDLEPTVIVIVGDRNPKAPTIVGRMIRSLARRCRRMPCSFITTMMERVSRAQFRTTAMRRRDWQGRTTT